MWAGPQRFCRQPQWRAVFQSWFAKSILSTMTTLSRASQPLVAGHVIALTLFRPTELAAPCPLATMRSVPHPASRLQAYCSRRGLGEDVGRVVGVVSQLATEFAHDGAHWPHVVATLPPDPAAASDRRSKPALRWPKAPQVADIPSQPGGLGDRRGKPCARRSR